MLAIQLSDPPRTGRAALRPVRYRRIHGALGRRDQPARPAARCRGHHRRPRRSWRAAEYEHLRALLSPLAMPVFVISGNHAAREPLRAAFAADGYLPADGFLQFTIEDYPVRLVALDTLIPGEAGVCYARSGLPGSTTHSPRRQRDRSCR